MTDRPTTEAGRLLLEQEAFLRIASEYRAALIDKLVAAVEGLPWNVAGQATQPVGGCDEEWAVGEYRAAVLRLLEGARHGK